MIAAHTPCNTEAQDVSTSNEIPHRTQRPLVIDWTGSNMSKRSLSETADGPLGTSASLSSPTSKRLKSNCMDISGALALIVDNSDKLIDCIKTLASQRSKFAKDTDQKLDLDSLELSTRKCLMRLSKKLLPAFQLFQEQSPVGTEQPLIQVRTSWLIWSRIRRANHLHSYRLIPLCHAVLQHAFSQQKPMSQNGLLQRFPGHFHH